MNLPPKNQVVIVGTFMVIFLYFFIAIPILIRLEESLLIKIFCGTILLSVPILLFKHIKTQLEKYIGFLWNENEDLE